MLTRVKWRMIEKEIRKSICSAHAEKCHKLKIVPSCRKKSLRKDTGYSTGVSSHEDNRKSRDAKRKEKKKPRKDNDDSFEMPAKKQRKNRESSVSEDEEKYEKDSK